VIKHQERHPTLNIPGCFGCRIAFISFGADAMPTRRAYCAETEAKDRLLHKDLDAYKRLRNDGTQPKKIDGSAEVEKRADEKWQVESGILPNA